MPDVVNPPPVEVSSDVDHDSTQGGTSGNPHAASASDSHGNASHSSTFAVDGDAQPPESHGDTEHEYDLQIDGAALTSGDTINFQT